MTSFEYAFNEVFGRLVFSWIDFSIKVLLPNTLIQFFIGLIFFILIFDKILPIRYLHLYQLSRQFITNNPRKGLYDSIKLFVEGGDVESTEF